MRNYYDGSSRFHLHLPSLSSVIAVMTAATAILASGVIIATVAYAVAAKLFGWA